MTLKVITVFDSITAISVSGLTVKDIDEVSETWQVRGATMYPLIDGLWSFNRPIRQTVGTGANKKTDLTYTLNYRVLYAPLGSTRGIKDIFASMMTQAAAIMDALNDLDAPNGAIDAQAYIVQGSPVVKDPAGNDFWGYDIAIDVLQFNEV